jgi:antitoxin ParD1/3/4
MNVSLTPQLDELVNRKVASGRYSSASEVMREALRLLEERDQLREVRLEELRRGIQIGIDQADRGELVPAAEVFTDLRERNRKFRKAKARTQ